MGQTKKRNYDRYTLEYKLQAVKLANNPNVRAIDIAASLGIHVVMLYRWQMEHRNGELRANKYMKAIKKSPKRRKQKSSPPTTADEELTQAKKRIIELERALSNRTEELDLLKKAERFFNQKTKK
jgi:transposase